jgi:ATP-dependent RNA helicase RhlE
VSFETFGLDSTLVNAVRLLGYEKPTAVQNAVIPAVLAGRNVQAQAETGAGKTLAFGVPLLETLLRERMRDPLAARPRGNPVTMLVLVPTRELATQVAAVLDGLGKLLTGRPKVLAVYGGVKVNPQMMALRGGADILVATPGRLLDLQRQNALTLTALRVLVLDEADRMLGLGFQEELEGILDLCPARHQTLLFSATFPATLAPLTKRLLRDPVITTLEPTHTPTLIEEHVYTVDAGRKRALLQHLLAQWNLKQALIFVSQKRTGDELVTKLRAAGMSAAVFHADRSQAERERTLSAFRNGELRLLVATDLAGRGIDLDALPAVVNFELPRSPNDYVHRIGRTGRAGKPGLALSLICPAEYQHFRVIEKRIKRRLEREQLAGFEVTSTANGD